MRNSSLAAAPKHFIFRTPSINLRFFSVRIGLGILILTIASVAFSAAEFLPEAKTPQEKQEILGQLGQLAPFIRQHATQDVLDTQEASLRALRMQFKDFDAWSNAKPSPITISISRIEAKTLKVSVLSQPLLKILLQSVEYNLSEILQQLALNKKEFSREELEKVIKSKILVNIATNSDGARGILIGLIQALPPEKRTAIFKANDTSLQLQLLRQSGLTDAQLRESNFRPESVGLQREQLTLNKVLSIAEARLNSSQELVGLIASLKFVQGLKSEDFNLLAKENSVRNLVTKVLNDVELNFLESIDSPFMRELNKLLSQENSKIAPAIQKALASMISQFSKTSFEVESRSIANNVPYLKVVEVHPYLAYFRGCVGGDCSTSNSPIYPFSPWEHVYYIIDRTDNFIGYVSATRVHMKGEPTLYLKDISGPTLSARDAELVLNAFDRVHHYYGTKRFAIAAPEFTDAQNHFPDLIAMLSKYNSKMKLIPVEFDDEKVRLAIGSNYYIFKSDNSYDSPDEHAEAGFFLPKKDLLAKYTVGYKVGTLSPFKPKSTKQALLFALDLLAGNPKASLVGIEALDVNEVKAIYQTLQNGNESSLEIYYATLQKSFARYDVDLSRTFRQDHPSLFAIGHLRAKDSFSVDQETLRSDSEKYFVNLVRQHGDFETIITVLKKWKAQLEESKRFQDLITLLTSRAELRDINYLIAFSDLGYLSARAALAKPNLKTKIESAIAFFFENSSEGSSESSAKNSGSNGTSIGNLESLLLQSDKLTSLEFSKRLDSLLLPLGLSLGKLSDPRLKKIIERARFQNSDAFTGPDRLKNSLALERLVQSHDLASAYKIIAKHPEVLKNTKAAIALVEKFASAPNPLNLLALFGLSLRGISPAQKAIMHPEFKQVLLSLFVRYSREPKLEFEGSAGNLYSWLQEQKILEPKNNIFALFKAAFPESRISEKMALDQLSESLGVLQVTLVSLLEDPELKKILTSDSNSFKFIFESKQNNTIAFGLKILELKILSGFEYEDILNSFLLNIEKLNQKNLTSAFAWHLISELENSKCEKCYEVLEQILPYKVAINTATISNTLLKRFVQSENPYVKLFAIQALTNRATPSFRPSEQDLESVARSLGQEGYFQSSQFISYWSEIALNILIQNRSKSEVVKKELKEVMQSEEDMRLVLKAAIAFLKNGGNPDRAKKEVRRAAKDLEVRRESNNELNALWDQYEVVFANPKSKIKIKTDFIENQSCKILMM